MEKLKVSIGKTYNLGNYESLRLDVGLEVDCMEYDPGVDVFEVIHKDVKGMLSKLEEKHHIAPSRREGN